MTSEVERITNVYLQRAQRGRSASENLLDPTRLVIFQSRQRAFVRLMRCLGIHTLSGYRVLEIGSGNADNLVEYLLYGADSTELYGIDVLTNDLTLGHWRSPNFRLSSADAQHLPFRNESFDIVTQYTVFTSVLDKEIRRNLANEMLRVVRQGGLVMSYDFWPNNPNNPDVQGLPLEELKSLFPGCQYYVQKVVLAPPIARKLAPISMSLCQNFEIVPFLRTHFLVGILLPRT